MRWAWLVSLPFLACVVCGCELTTIEGSGNVVTRTLDVDPATRVSLEAPALLVITQGPEVSLTVTGDDNLVDLMTSDVEDGTLRLAVRGTQGFSSIRPTVELRLELTLPAIDGVSVSGSGVARAESLSTSSLAIAVSGSGEVDVRRLTGQALSAAISGSGEVRLVGEVATQSIAVSGSGEYTCGDLRSGKAEVAVSGSGDVTVWVEQDLDAEVSGSGSILYFGAPAVERNVSGSGEIRGLGPHTTSA